MRTKQKFFYWTAWLLVLLLAAPPWTVAQDKQGTQESKPFKQEELGQMLAPVALYPDELLTQLLMASTYPLEIVQAARWTKQNKDLKGDALTEALEKQDWDPSVKSLVNFPDVLAKMNENLEWTQKMGDAFLAQQKEVMDTIQMLRKKAQEAGNLKTTEQQKVVVEQETIIIQPASPEVVYVPSYNPAVVYGGWWWPAFPPPPPFFPMVTPYGGALAFGAGVAMGAAWGYAWGHANWHGGDVNVNASRNTNINNNINREKYKTDMKNKGMGEGGQGKWQHDASHRKGASYRDQGTAQKFNRGTTSDAAKSRDAFRGRADQGKQDLSRGGGDRGSSDRGSSQRGGRDSAFGGGSQRGSEARQQSNRGASSRESASSRGGSGGGGRSSGGGGGGGGRSGGGGGGGRSGGGGGGGRR